MIETLSIEPSLNKQVQKSTWNQRVLSIDIARALTMVLMIFVNDLWTLNGIPLWLEHVKPGVDGIGLADVVFPAFLFIVGLSLPFAVDNRRKRGEGNGALLLHVLARTVALLTMGVFLVNGETINAAAMGIPKYLWYPLCCLCFILIWAAYPKGLKTLAVLAKTVGVITLVVLALYYRGGEDGSARFAPQWWGILGLIGWAYLASGVITVLSKNNFFPVLLAWVFFCVLSMVSKAGLIPHSAIIDAIPDAIRGGTLTALTLGGVLTSLVFQHYRKRNENTKLTIVLFIFSFLLIIVSIVTRPYWKLSKLGATPAWLFLCSAFTILLFLAVYWVVDVWRKPKMFEIIKPAGTDTLLCYLIPYFAYAVASATSIALPSVLLTEIAGLLKSALFALLCVWVTGLLNKVGVKLKL